MTVDGLNGRIFVRSEVERELHGPSIDGKDLNTSEPLVFDSWVAARGPWRDWHSKQEILTEQPPSRRYGVGILKPSGVRGEILNNMPGVTVTAEEVAAEHPQAIQPSKVGRVSDDGDEFDLSLANAREQSSLGTTFKFESEPEASISVEATFGRYRKLPAVVSGVERTWWRREDVSCKARLNCDDLTRSSGRLMYYVDESSGVFVNADGLNLEIAVFSREVNGDRMLTVTVTNKSQGSSEESILFQSRLKITCENGASISPYPSEFNRTTPNEELQSLALLYRDQRTFAIGHGCAADWSREPKDSIDSITASCLPSFEVPSITPDILDKYGNRITVDMLPLTNLAGQRENAQIQSLLEGYSLWITQKRTELSSLSSQHKSAAKRHLDDCDIALSRMRAGWRLVNSDQTVRTAFELANEAMLVQQARASSPTRRTVVSDDGRVTVDGNMPSGKVLVGRGSWRPFQIAFLLASIESSANNESEHRDWVDLIFFPTGGGKTEAYLALSAFSILLRRLRDPEDDGTEVIMRYTLRLLTAQQFLRCSALICALESIRRTRGDLGNTQFSIGVWLGGTTTPNTYDAAVKSWNSLANRPYSAANMFLLLKCPWCGAKLGPTREQLSNKSSAKKRRPIIPGYTKTRDRVFLNCPDIRCDFHRALPLYVIDEDVYKYRPTIILGTVDKFAMLPWRPQARSIFGLDNQGRRTCSPPGLIVQDEFHLISGPLGSMVGLYESVIEDMCTDHRGSVAVKPKIIAATATTRRYAEQAKSIYARSSVKLFPPPGLSTDDSYFAVWARDVSGKLLPGRMYVGIFAPALGSIQSAQVRIGASLLQAATKLPAEQRDPWWTNLWFFNSLRELGNTLSLFQSDVPDYLVGVRNRDNNDAIRYPSSVMELTSRRRNDEIPRAIEELENVYPDGVVDVCLASSIVEVGVDIERLSLMTVVGQPKTTAQYIQVSGRVGRKWLERPGLVFTLYGALKPRDRSHFERFRSYHEKLYAQVEPTSVTPFSKPVLDRALVGAIVSHIRLRNPSLAPWPFPANQFAEAASIVERRAAFLGVEEFERVHDKLAEISKQWKTWELSFWEANLRGDGDPLNGLMRYAGTAEAVGVGSRSWEVPTSMRNVDAECRASVTTLYNTLAEGLNND